MTDSPMQPTRPVWIDPDEQTFPPVRSDLSVDVAIIGGGIAGVGAAYWLQTAGVSNIVLLESRAVASGASGRNAGFVMAVSPENFPPRSEPSNLEMVRRTWRFTDENQRMITTALDEFTIDAEYETKGSVCLAASQAEWNWIRDSSEVARESGVLVHIIEGSELATPWLRANYLGGASYPGNAAIHPAKFVRGLANALSAEGLRIYERSPVVHISEDSDVVTLVVNGRAIRANRVVLATNAYTAAIWPDLGRWIAATRGQVLATNPLDSDIAPCPAYANNGFQYWRQTRDGRLVLGGWRDMDMSTEVGTEERLNETIQHELTRVATGLTDGAAEIEYRWSGIMGFTPDRQPLMGMVPGAPNIAIVAGFSGHGLAMAFHAARHAVEALLGRESEYSDLFDPGRFERTPGSAGS